MNNWIAIFFVLTVSLKSAFGFQNKTLIISDVDDTLKVVHVLNIWDAIRWGFQTDHRFYGMNDLYNRIAQENQDAEFIYLSNAPEYLMKDVHEKFLKKGNFPEGIYIPRRVDPASTHKYNHIRQLLDEKKPDQVILIGDNGERDAIVYHQIYQEYAPQGIKFYPFIRLLYSSTNKDERGVRPYPEQIGFVSSVDIAINLYKNHILNDLSQLRHLLLANILHIIEEDHDDGDELVFPEFTRCEDYQWILQEFVPEFILLDQYRRLTDYYCHY